MPMVPQAVIAMLACARIGALRGVRRLLRRALHSRILDAEARLVITFGGQYRRGGALP